jgi:hypothetical protein
MLFGNFHPPHSFAYGIPTNVASTVAVGRLGLLGRRKRAGPELVIAALGILQTAHLNTKLHLEGSQNFMAVSATGGWTLDGSE